VGYCGRCKNIIIDCAFQRDFPFCEGLARGVLNNKVGFINTQGNLCIKNVYEDASDFKRDLARVRKFKKMGLY